MTSKGAREALVKPSHGEGAYGGDGELLRWEQHAWPTLVVRGTARGSVRSARSKRN